MTENQITKFINKEKKILALFGAGLILAVIIFGPIISTLRERMVIQKDLNRQKNVLEKKLEMLQGIEGPLITDRVEKMEAVFPSKKPVVELMSSLSKLSKKHGLIFGGLTLSPGELGKEGKSTNPDLHDFSFGFQVGGDFNSISNFLKDLETTAPLMRIEKMALSIKTAPLLDRAQTILVVNMNVVSYYQAPPKELGGVSNPIALLTKKDESLLNKLISFQTFEVIVPSAPTGKVDLFGAGR